MSQNNMLSWLFVDNLSNLSANYGYKSSPIWQSPISLCMTLFLGGFAKILLLFLKFQI